MNVGLLEFESSKSIKKELSILMRELGHSVLVFKEVDYFAGIQKIANELQAKKIDRAVIIDDYGQQSFLIASKYRNIVCASLTNEYTAELTMEHNNTNVVCFGTSISGLDLIKNMLKVYLTSDFDGGRHLVRTDMLRDMIK